MSDVLKTLAQQLSGQNLQQLSNRLGTDEQTTQSALAAALPMLLGGLARNAQRPEGARDLHGALQRDHDGSVLDNLSEFLTNPNETDGHGILRHVFGNRRQTVESGVSRASGLDSANVGRMLAMVAPIVMGALGRTQRQQNLDERDLANLLTNEETQVQKEMPELGGLSRLLDSDGDGQIADDLANIGKKLLGGLFSRR